MLVLCCDCGPWSRHGSQAQRTTRPRRVLQAWTCNCDARPTAQCACMKDLSSSLSRQESLCRDTISRHVGWFGSRHRLSLPRQRFWVLYRDRVSLALCHDRVSSCRDKVFPRMGHSYHDRRLYVVTEIPRVVLQQDVFMSRPIGQACPHDSALDMHDRPRLPARQTSYSVLSRQRFSIATDFSRLSVVTENPGIWDFPCRDMGLMSR